MKNRIWELDFIRGIAIILMIIFHIIVDLKDFYDAPIDYKSGFWYYEGKLSAIIFILISGAVSSLGVNNFRRGLKVFGCGMVLTIITFLFMSESYIRFGILHMLGTGMIFYSFIGRLNQLGLLLIAFSTIALGNVFLSTKVESPYLYPFGLVTRSFNTMDYYPILPWLGVFVIGVFGGRLFYKNKSSILWFTWDKNIISSMGRHSLVIYLVHQPLILGVMFVVSKIV